MQKDGEGSKIDQISKTQALCGMQFTLTYVLCVYIDVCTQAILILCIANDCVVLHTIYALVIIEAVVHMSTNKVYSVIH